MNEINHHRLLNTAAFFGLTVFAVVINSLLAAMTRISGEFALDSVQVGRIIAVYFVGFFIASLVGGVVSDRTGKRPVIIAGYLINIATLMIFILSKNIYAISAVLLLMGLGGGILESLLSAFLAEMNKERNRSVLALSQLFYCLGAIAGPFLVGLLFSCGVSWRMYFLLLTVFPAVGVVPFMLVRFRSEEHGSAPAAERKPFRISLLFLLPLVLMFFYVLVETAFIAWIPFLLADHYKLAEPLPQWIFSGFWLMFMAGRLGVSFIPRRVSSIGLITVKFFFAALAIGVLLMTQGTMAAVMSFLVIGLCLSGIWPLIVSLSSELFPENQATALGVIIGAGGAAAGLMPFVSGYALKSGGVALHYAITFCLALAALILSAVLGVALRRQRHNAIV